MLLPGVRDRGLPGMRRRSLLCGGALRLVVAAGLSLCTYLLEPSACASRGRLCGAHILDFVLLHRASFNKPCNRHLRTRVYEFRWKRPACSDGNVLLCKHTLLADKLLRKLSRFSYPCTLLDIKTIHMVVITVNVLSVSSSGVKQ